LKEHVPKLKSRHDGVELWGVDIVSKGMQNSSWERCVKEIYLEENSHSCLTGISGQKKKIIKPQCCLDDRDAIVLRRKATPLVLCRPHENTSQPNTGSDENYHTEERS